MILIALLDAIAGNAISFKNPGIRLELFLKEISKQTGKEFHSPTYLRNEVIAASFKNQSIEIVKSRLAKIIHGTWTQMDDGWWLSQTSEQKKEEGEWNQSVHDHSLQPFFDTLRPLIPKAAWTINDAEKYWIEKKSLRSQGNDALMQIQREAHLKKGPEGRFAATLLGSVSPSSISILGYPNESRYYSTAGLPNQFNLPVNLNGALDRYREEAMALQAISGTKRNLDSIKYFELQYSGEDDPQFFIAFYDKAWTYRFSYFVPTPRSPSVMAEGEDFPLAQATQQAISLKTDMMDGDPDTYDDRMAKSPILLDMMETFRHATVRDPLGIRQGKCWIDYASSTHQPVLVNLEDDTKEFRPEHFVPKLHQIGFTVGMQRLDIDGWVLGRPVDPLRNREIRMDRRLIEKLAVAISGPQQNSIESNLLVQDIGMSAQSFTNGIPNSDIFDLVPSNQNYFETLSAAVGTLTKEEFDRCLKGEIIPFAKLSSRAQYFISQWLLSGEKSAMELVPEAEANTCPRYLFRNGFANINLGAKFDYDYSFEFASEPMKDGEGMTTFAMEDFAHLLSNEVKRVSLFDEIQITVSSKQILSCSAFLGQKSSSSALKFGKKTDQSQIVCTWKTMPSEIKQRILQAQKKPPDK